MMSFRCSRSLLHVLLAAPLCAGPLAACGGADLIAPATEDGTSKQAQSFPGQLPFMCFNTAHAFHQIFGPQSFFLNENQQGPTGFQEGGATSKPTLTFPLHQGIAAGHAVYYVITDASDPSLAAQLGVNYTPKLGQALGTASVQVSSSNDPAAINVPGDVDFSPARVLVAGTPAFPPATATPGAVGSAGYSPLVQISFNGAPAIINAPQIGDGANTNAADKTHWADKVESVDTVHNTVTYDETNGCYEDQSVHYASFDSSSPVAATIEDATLAPALDSVPSTDCGTNDINVTASPFIAPGCARESLIAFINGQTGPDNVQRQGENAAILDARDSPLNILEDVPNLGGQFNYSPMWDIHLVRWNDSVPLAGRVRQTDFARAEALIGTQAQSVTPGGLSDTFQATGFVVNCPVLSLFANK